MQGRLEFCDNYPTVMKPNERNPETRPSLLARLNDSADPAAWEEFVALYGPLVLAELGRRGFEHTDAEDLAQAVFLRVFHGVRGFRVDPSRGRFRDWLGAVIRNEALRFWRDRGRKPARLMPGERLDAQPDSAPDPEWVDAFQSHIFHVALDRCRHRFEEPTWRAFEEVWMRGKSAPEAAKLLAQSVDNIYVAKSRVLAALTEMVVMLTDDVAFFGDRA